MGRPILLKFTDSGAKGGDVINEELKRRFHGLTHMRASVLRKKLRIPHIEKPKDFFSAMYNAGGDAS